MSSNTLRRYHHRKKLSSLEAISRLARDPNWSKDQFDIDDTYYLDPIVIDDHFNRLYEMSNV